MNRYQTLAATAIASAALLFFVGGTAVAASHGHSGHTGGEATAGGSHQQMMKQVDTKAQVVAVAADGKSMEIDHQPIPELGWPAMQMSLDLESPDLATGIATGDQVTVTIKQLSATQYVITNIKK